MEFEKDTRWDSISASITPKIVDTSRGEVVHLAFTATVWSDRDGEWKTLTVHVEADRLERYDWLYARTLDLLVRDLACWTPR